MSKILLLEDDQTVGKAVADALMAERYTVEWVENGQEALDRVRMMEYDLLILDWSVPEVTGVDVCAKFREEGGKTLVLMLTGKHLVSEKITALDAGADDYITKPFHIDELTARVRALLRRSGADFTPASLTVGDLSIDPQSFTVVRDGHTIQLIPKEFAILELFMRYPGVVFSQEAIFRRIWKADEDSSVDIVRTHIKNMRKKLEASGQPAPIQTIHGVGYKLSKG